MTSNFDTPAAASAVPPRRFQIRPLSTGEVLDRTISLYGSNFWFCTGAAAVSALVSLLSGASRIIYLQVYHLSPLTTLLNSLPIALITIFWGLVALLMYGISQAALSWGLGSSYLGRPATLAGALSVIRRHWLRYPGIVVMQILTAAWLTLAGYVSLLGGVVALRRQGPFAIGIITAVAGLLILASFPFSIIRYIRLALAMPASVLEGLPVRAALQRSRALLPDRKGRVFVIFLLAGALYLPLSVVAGTMALLSVRETVSFIVSQATTLLLTFAAAMLIQPLFSAAFVILYYDERVRREGFDIQFMMSESQGAMPNDAVPAPQFPPSSVRPGESEAAGPEPAGSSDRYGGTPAFANPEGFRNGQIGGTVTDRGTLNESGPETATAGYVSSPATGTAGQTYPRV